MPVSPGSILLVQVRGRLHGQRVMNNFYYWTLNGSGDNITNATIAAQEAWLVLNADRYANCVSSELDNITVRSQILAPNGTPNPTRFMFYETPSTAVEGAVVGNALPSSVTAVVRRRTTLSGRQFRGRVYVPGIPTAWEIDSLLTEEGQEALQDNMGEILTDAIVAGATVWEAVVTNAPTFTLHTLITAAAVDPVLRIQRRREVGVGE